MFAWSDYSKFSVILIEFSRPMAFTSGAHAHRCRWVRKYRTSDVAPNAKDMTILPVFATMNSEASTREDRRISRSWADLADWGAFACGFYTSCEIGSSNALLAKAHAISGGSLPAPGGNICR